MASPPLSPKVWLPIHTITPSKQDWFSPTTSCLHEVRQCTSSGARFIQAVTNAGQREVGCASPVQGLQGAVLATGIGQGNPKICLCQWLLWTFAGTVILWNVPCFPSSTLCFFWPVLRPTPYQTHLRTLPSLGTPAEVVQSQLCARHKGPLS